MPPCTFHNLFTFTLLLGRAVFPQTPKYSEYRPSEQSPVVSALSPTSFQPSGTISPMFLSAILPLSLLLCLPSKPFSFRKPFLRSHCPEECVCVCVCVCARARARVRACVRACVCFVCIESWKECVSAYGLCGLGALSTHYCCYYYITVIIDRA